MDNKKNTPLTAVVSNIDGEIFDLDGFAAVGSAGTSLVILTEAETIPIPHGGELMFLPDRMPILFNMETGCFETRKENPYVSGEQIFPVAVFNSPGYVNTATTAYEEGNKASLLPLFSYGAAGFLKDDFRSAVIQIDSEPRQDLRYMAHEKIIDGVQKIKELMPANRLRNHIEKCALEYGCPAAKNFFLGRYEAPLPTSGSCNSRCLGCISLQKGTEISSPQERIAFTPKPEEIVEVAMHHIQKVKKSIVSFGQGCEGDPLMAAHVIEPALKKIRSLTNSGTINMNTNGSRPDILAGLLDAGLDSIRVSINSFRQSCYHAYFRPVSYSFEDVVESIDIAVQKGKFVSINYLNCPGVTDTTEEIEALYEFLDHHTVHLIQWRNLNFDPKKYREIMFETEEHGEPIGMSRFIRLIKKRYPALKHGYFNPPKETF
ncbi:MAG: radical SAM protein [Deltaproteobacteria bacterium]|nr:radical SAM protein [Deltaproteobacteria bacterium]